MPEDYALSLEEIKRMMANAGGTNLAGQSMAGPVATGQSYAQSIAGGMPMSQVIAPGVSYSPEQSGGYTQADLDFLARGPAPVMLAAPTTGEVATIDDQMVSAPVGVTQPTPWIPGQTPFPGIGNFDFLKDLDFSSLPGMGDMDMDAIIQEYQDRINAGEPEPFDSFLPTQPDPRDIAYASVGGPGGPPPENSPNFLAFQQTPGYQDFINSGAIGTMDMYTASDGREFGTGTLGRMYDDYLASLGQEDSNTSAPTPAPEPVFTPPPPPPEPNGFFPGIDPEDFEDFDFGNMDFSNIPNYQMPAPTMPALTNIPQIPNFPIQQPMNFTGLPNIPALSAIQPRVEDIIAPIRTGSTRRLPQPGLFNLR